MLKVHTSVIARRVRITGDFATLPYEAGWAGEAVFFVQAEGAHPDLTVRTEISPDGVSWLPRGDLRILHADASILDSQLTVFGNWVRVVISGATEERPARVLVHAVFKG